MSEFCFLFLLSISAAKIGIIFGTTKFFGIIKPRNIFAAYHDAVPEGIYLR